MAERNPSGRDRDDQSMREAAPAGATEAQARTGQQQRGGGASTERQGGEGRGTTERERPLSTTREGARGTGLARMSEPGGALMPWGMGGSPFTLMHRVIDDMDRMFENFGFGRLGSIASPRLSALTPWSDVGDFFRPTTAALWAPPLEVFERGNTMVVRAELPGVSKEDVNVEVEDGALTISGERRHEQEESREGYYHSERRYGAFSRSIPLPEGVDANQVEAKFRDGVLEITVPKPEGESARRRRVEIR